MYLAMRFPARTAPKLQNHLAMMHTTDKAFVCIIDKVRNMCLVMFAPLKAHTTRKPSTWKLRFVKTIRAQSAANRI